mgnify:FL=1
MHVMEKAMNRVLGIDFGEKFVGLAISDPSKKYSLPLEIIDTAVVFPHVRKLISYEAISTIVIGLAITPSGRESEVAKQARRLGNRLIKLGVKIVFENEELTTFAAKKSQQGIPSAKYDDHLAASLILQQYLNRNIE